MRFYTKEMLYQSMLDELTYKDVKNMLHDILTKVYSNQTIVNAKMAALTSMKDRKRLLEYLNNPNIRNPHKFIELFYHYRVNMRAPGARRLYMTNNFDLLDSDADKTLLYAFTQKIKQSLKPQRQSR